MDDTNNGVPAVERALNILEYIGNKKTKVTVKEVSDYLDIPIASAIRIVKTLVNRGYLVESKGGASSFTLGLRILHLSQGVIKNTDLVALAIKHMRVLSSETNQASQLAILQQNSVIYIEQVLSTKSVSIIAPLHTPITLNTSASGKVLCAWRTSEQQKKIVEPAEFIKATDRSIVNKKLFYKELENVKIKGYAIDDEEFAIGIGCMAVPVFDYTNEIIAAIGITGHISAYKNQNELKTILASMKQTAAKISGELGYIAK